MVAYLNDSGGVFGAEVDLQIADTAGDAEVAGRTYARLNRLDANPLLVLICDPLTQAALADSLTEDRIPAILLGPRLTGQDDSIPPAPFFALDLPVEQHFALWLDVLAADWDALQPAGAGAEIRLALFSGPPQWGGAAGTPAALARAESLGIDIVLEVSLEDQPDLDVYEPIYRARDANANVIYTSAPSRVSAELLNALNFLGLRERFLVAGPAASIETPFFTRLSQPAFSQGLLISTPVVWWGAGEDADLARAETIFTYSERDEEERLGSYLVVLAAMDLAKRALEDAILAGGFEALDAAAVHEALEALEGYELLGGLAAMDFSSGLRAPSSLQIVQLGPAPAQATIFQDFTEVPDLLPVE